QCRRALRDRNHRPAVVGIPRGERGATPLGCHQRFSAPALGDPAAVGCVGRLRGAGAPEPLSETTMTVQTQTKDKSTLSESSAVPVRLPGFIKDEDVGRGDAIKRVTYAFGIRGCGGCEQRTAALNRWMVFTR